MPTHKTFPTLQRGDRVAILSPAFAAPGFAPAVHEQAMERIRTVLQLEPVEYPTTRQLDASPKARAADIHAAFGDPTIKAIFATIGGHDQITVIPHLSEGIVRGNPKPFFGYSDNTNLSNWLWKLGIPSYYGGSTQVQIGAGPGLDDIHLAALSSALFTGGERVLTDPRESEDFGPDWLLDEALTQYGEREPTEPWDWFGPKRVVTGRTWGGCLEVLDQIGLAGQFPTNNALEGTILLLETSEAIPPADWVYRWVRALGERGLLECLSGVLVARPPASAHEEMPSKEDRVSYRAKQRDVIAEVVAQYNPEAVVCIGVPFGHTRPQWIVPHGGTMTLDGIRQVVSAQYSLTTW